jgi:hypothetical protein
MGPVSKHEGISQLAELAGVLRARSAIAVCGPGLAVPLGYPTSQQLKQLLVSHLHANSPLRPEDVRLAVEERAAFLPELAGYVRSETNNPEAWLDFLRSTYGSRVAQSSYELDCLVRLPVCLNK